MKKILIFIALLFASFSLYACNGEEDPIVDNGNDNGNNNGNDNGDNNDNNNGGSGTQPVRNVVLTYADWGNQTVNQLLIDAFMEMYPNIRVELRRDITGAGDAFTENLLNAQAAGILPDVFAIDNVPTAISAGMALDVAEFWDADPDTQYVFPNIANTAVYNGRRYAVPSFQFIKGIFINLTLLDRYNIPEPPKDWNYDEFVALAVQLRQAGIDDNVYGIYPWFGDLDFEAIWPTQDYADVGYNTFDGERFHFTSQAWIDGYQAKLDLWAQDVVWGYDPDVHEEMGGTSIWPWSAGFVGMKIDGSWQLGLIDEMYRSGAFDVGFWPYPGGAAGQFPPTILDYAVVSSQTDNPEEAYLLAKWMTFGRQGWMTRLDIMEDSDILFLDRFPVADYPEVWDRAAPFIDYFEGVRENIDLLEYSKPDVDKWLAGYKAFWVWVEQNEYWDDIAEGNITPEVLAREWEDRLNQMISDALNELLD